MPRPSAAIARSADGLRSGASVNPYGRAQHAALSCSGRAAREAPGEHGMASTELHALLRQLHEELGRTAAFDDEARRLLGMVLDDVRRIGAAPAGGEPEATPGNLEALAVRFEADHPAMAAALRQVADLLGKAGI